jgi:hypothetical protein
MSKPRSYKTFSTLVEAYRKRKGYSITDVSNFIRINCDWPISPDAIRKFDRGLREPSPEYVIMLKKFLNLNEDQYTKLLDAIVGDYQVALFESYQDATERLIKKGVLNDGFNSG